MNNQQRTIMEYWQGNLLRWMGQVSWNLGHHKFQPQYYQLSSALQILLSKSKLQYEQHHPVPNLHYTYNIKQKHGTHPKIKKIYTNMLTPSNSAAGLPLQSAISIGSLVFCSISQKINEKHATYACAKNPKRHVLFVNYMLKMSF